MKAKPPTAVAFAAWLLFSYGLLSLIRLWIYGNGLPSSLGSAVIWLLAIALFACVARALYMGRSWARWLLAAGVGVALVVFPLLKPELPHGAELGLYALQVLMPIAATALIFTRRARAWFQA